MLRHSRKMRKSNKKVHYGGRHIVLTLILLMCLFVIYRFNFRTKSDVVETKHVSFVEYTNSEFEKNSEMKSDEDVVLEIGQDENENKYIQFPDKINGYHVDRYRLLANKKTSNVDSEAGNGSVNSNSNSINSNAKISENITNSVQNVQNSVNINTINSNSTNVIDETKNFSYLTSGRTRKFLSEEKEAEDIDQTTHSNTENSNGIADNSEELRDNDDSIQNSNSTENTNSEVNQNENRVEPEISEMTSNTVNENTIKANESDENNNTVEASLEAPSEEIPTVEKEKTEVVQDEIVREKIFVPGDKYFFNDGEVLEFEVMYKTVIINDKKLYKQDLLFEGENEVIITATGYIPEGYVLNVKPENKDEMNELKKGVTVEDDAVNLELTDVLAAYDISIVKKELSDESEEKNEGENVDSTIVDEYQPKDFNQTIELSITSKDELSGKLVSSTIIPVHVKKTTEEVTNENGETYEEETYQFDQFELKNKMDDTVEFYTDSFSTFMLLSLRAINANAFRIIDDTLSDENYFKGKNYTDNLAGTNQNLYRDDNKVEVTINYYGYDDVNGPMVAVVDNNKNPTYDPVTGELIEERACGYISHTERNNAMTYKLTRYKDASNNISVELIDNPFMDRPVNNFNKYQPVGYGFNGWLSHSTDDVITTDTDSFEQTLTRNVGTNTSVTINLYVDWRQATYIFLNEDGNNNRYFNYATGTTSTSNNCNPGTDPTQPLSTTDLAMTRINNNYRNATNASNRELNIIVLQNGDFDFFLPTNAVTITSLYDGQSTKSNNTYFNIASSRVLNYDLQLDYLNTNCGNFNRDPGQRFNQTNYYLIGNGNNLRIGRGMMPLNTGNDRSTFTQVYGGFNYDVDRADAKNYKLVVESGRYSTIVLGNGTDRGRGTVYSSAKGIFGCDIDRANNDHDDFYVYAGLFGRTGAGTIYPKVAGGYTFDMRVRSGTICVPYFDSRAGQYVYSGIYLGGTSNAGTAGDKGHKRLIIEGGNVANIMGGRSVLHDDAHTSHTHVYVKGGTVANIVGGAGAATGYGDRAIQVTGGTIRYSVSGAANGFSSGNGQGNLPSACMVYIGGNATIGTENGELYGVPAGTIHGAGNGNNGARQTAGLAGSTHVIIDGSATIKGSVYAGGNYGQVKPDTNQPTYTLTRENMSRSFNTTDTYIIAAGLESNAYYLYDDGNNRNAGRRRMEASTETPDDGKWKIVRSGAAYYIQSASDPTKYLNIRYSRYSYPQYSAYVSGTQQIFTINNRGNDAISLSATANGNVRYISPSVNSGVNNGATDVYLIKETREDIVNPENPDHVIAKVDILGGTINGDVYGGANNNDISGSSQINVEGGTVKGTVYGGSNTSGNINEKVFINVRGGTIGTATTGDALFAGGRGSGTRVIEDATVTITDDKTNVSISGNIYGGSEEGRVTGNTKISVDENITSSPPSITIKGKIFGGGKGVANGNVAINEGNTEVEINGLDSTSEVTVFGGANLNGRTDGHMLVKIGENKTSYVTSVYGGGDEAEVLTNTDYTHIYLYEHASAKNVYGGGNEAGIDGTNTTPVRSAIYVSGATITQNVYGGSNTSGTVQDSYVYMSDDASASAVYGGGCGANTKVNRTHVYFDDATATSVYGGGDEGEVGLASNTAESTYIEIKNSTGIDNVFGGGNGRVNQNVAKTIGNTKVTIDNSSIDLTVFGGGNYGKVEGKTDVIVENKSQVTTVYGGGSLAEVTGTTNVDINDSTCGNVYGGGSEAEVGGNTKVNIEAKSKIDNVFGGGKGTTALARMNTEVSIDDSTINHIVYGGGDSANVSGSTKITIDNHTTAEYVYGGGKNGKVTNNTDVTVNDSTISENIFGGGHNGDVDKKATVKLNGGSCNKVYGGGEAADVSDTDVSIINNARVQYAFGGGQGTTANTLNNTKIIINDSQVTKDVYGGGDAGPVAGSTVVGLTNARITESAYAAGNGQTATVGKNSYIYAEGTTTIGESIFGGGNAATTGDNSSDAWSIVDIAGATIGKNVYGGANSSVIKGSAIVNIGNKAIEEFYKNPVIRDKTNNSNITINNPNKKVTITGEGANAVVTSDLTLGKIAITGTVFGGGEQMVAGSTYTFDAISVEAVIDINLDGTGYDSTNPLTLNGSIFGSGNASSANKNGDITIKNWGTYTDVKKFTSIQRTGTVEIANSFISLVGITDSTNFDGRVSYTFNIVDDAVKLKDGTTLYLYCGANKVNAFESVYSDNTSTTGESYNKVRVLNYVFDENNQRVYMVDGDEFKDASGTRIAYIGQNNKYFSDSDKTVEVSPATLNSINELIESGRRIETQSVTSDADNRLYMHTGKNINISANEANPETDPKEVKGMTFFGLFTEGGATGFYSGIYDKNYAFGRSIQRSEREFLSAYVMGHHQDSPEHDILVDGFYTNYENIDHNDYENYQEMDADTENYHSTMYVSVITPTPKEASYYRWYCRPGEQIFHYEGSLRASKFSTFGTANIALVFDDVHPNAKISLQSVEVTKINEFGIYDKNTIPNIAATPEEALTRFGMSMKTSNFGWKLNGETNFFYDPVRREAWYPATDTTKFEIENSNTIPEFNFYLFNSNNITEKRQLGTYTITMRMEYAVDALNVGSAILIFDLILDTENYGDQVGYNAAITPGEQYELFSTSTTNVSNKSKFSAFFELAQENFKATKIKGSEDTVATYYNGLYRVLSTRNYVFPKGTTITMIDKSIAGNPKYYYYNVTAADVTNNKTEFRLTDFYDMGNKDLKYDEAAGQAIYYNATTDYEYENFIFIFNFESAEFTGLNDQLDYEAIVEHEPLGIELRADVMNVPRQIFTVLDGQRENDMYFGIYKAETTIDISGVLSKNRIYLGNQVRLTATTDYNVANVSGAATMIFDTRYFDKKLGIVISIYERGKNGNPDRRLEGSDVLGVSFTLGSNTYYPRADGTTRIKIAEKVSNVSSPIIVNTEGASLASGDYYFILQSFGSPDGIYFGTDVSAVSSEISFTVINDLYGLDVRVPDRESIVEGDDGHILTEEGRLSKTENSLDVTINYSSGLANPYLGVSLYRRIYDDEIYGNQYEKVDLDSLVQENLVPVRISYSNEENELPNLYEYEAFDVDYIESHVDDNTQTTSFTQTYTYEEGPLKTGTYKLMYTLYDRYDTQIVITDEETGTNYYQNVQEYEKIGEDFAYIIVK